MRALGKLALVAVASLSLPGAAEARDEWYDHYRQGKQALEDGRTAEAVERLEQALERKPRSGYLRTYGNNYIHYAPRFHLGAAYHQAGDCPRALALFRDSAASDEDGAGIADTRDALRSDCEERLRPVQPEPEPELDDPPLPAPPEPQVTPLNIDRAQLERGIRAYLAGNYDEAIDVFEAIVAGEKRSPRLHLFLGASLHGAWSAGGEAPAALLERATSALREAATRGGAQSADPAIFPPRVVSLLRSLR